MTFKIFRKVPKYEDIEVTKVFNTERAFVPTERSFAKKEDAINWCVDNATIYAIREEPSRSTITKADIDEKNRQADATPESEDPEHWQIEGPKKRRPWKQGKYLKEDEIRENSDKA
jgi:hypothetical protein